MFELEFLNPNGTESELDWRKRALVGNLEKFHPEILKSHKYLKWDIEHNIFWHLLDFIHGENEEIQDNWKLDFENEFTGEEQQIFLTIALNMALLSGDKIGKPGYELGHSTIYEKIAGNVTSLFYDSITNDFRKRLHNGRLWENLPQLQSGLNFCAAYPIVESVLVEHVTSFDEEFVPEGLKIFRRNRGYVNSFDLTNDMEDFQRRASPRSNLSERAIANYGEVFFPLVEKKMRGNNFYIEDMAIMAQAYIGALDMMRDNDDLLMSMDENKRRVDLIDKYGRFFSDKLEFSRQ